ncbi:MAG: PAS domain-containing sensor histidine kinase, partial [Caldimonas sp.]
MLPGADQLFEEMPCGLLVTGVDGTILRVNHTFCTWVGLGADELVGRKKLQDLFTMGARIFHHTHWLPMLEMQGSISEVKFDVNGKGGAKIPMLLNVIRRRSGSGDYDQVSAVIAEERNKYESELVAARKRADASVVLEQDRSLFAEQMIGIVSHDLRNPLAVVMAATTVLERSGELTSEKSRRMLASIVRAGQRSRRLIEDLLDFTAARVGRGLVVDRQRADLHQIAGRAVEEMSVAFPDRKILQRAEGDGVVLADSDRLVQLLGNLIGNALTYG